MLELLGVNKYYKNKQVLFEQSISIASGEFNIFLGENGSGKSTCLKLISKAISLDKRDSGKILNDYSKISYLPEKFLLPGLVKVQPFLKKIKKLYGSEADVDEFMSRFKIPNKYIFSLSKGMNQKLGIVIALIIPADLYIFDEPLDGLDSEARKTFKEQLNALLLKKKTIIISTHQKMAYKGIKANIFNFSNNNEK